MSGTVEILQVVVTIAGLGVVAQIFSDRLQVPSVVFLLLAGVFVGPEGLGVVTPAVFGGSDGALPAIVGLSVAIIVFEGAFSLRTERLREAPRATFRLVTFGAAITLFGTTVFVHTLLGTSWGLALLIGSLLVATGPTVITPIVNVVMVREQVASTLETEGVVNDVTAAILAVVTFEYVVLETRGLGTFFREFLYRLGAGVAVGLGVAVLVWLVLTRIESRENEPQNARLVVLVAALVAYGVGESILPEAGIAAVATAGFVLGNVDLPYRETIERFKGDVTLLVNSFVFITLASLFSLGDLGFLGVAGLLTAVAVALVVRPLAVWFCTIGTSFTLGERAFMSFVGPRGIIPASVATLFALELQTRNPEAATTLVGTVFLVIFLTVTFEGGGARHIAQALHVIPKRVLIVGGGRIGRSLADRLADRGEEVVIVDRDESVIESLRADGYTVREGDATERGVIESAGIANARVVALATADDDVNLLVAQLANNTFDVETVISRVNEPNNVDAFEDLDVETVSSWRAIAWSMDNLVERPAIARWMTELDETGDVQEIEVTAEEHVGESVANLSGAIPEGAHLAMITRDGESYIPDPDQRIEWGDHLTFLGRHDAVRAALEYCETA
ncbi:cation:proton antiporter domain-containing protein [Halorhabdus rudnickae]|uniref:cation:proton antiporter domain-containing protein n=1 Tax=Halorhabdus rudnickae TaxID=1775544 RepID=UPI001082F1F6|nr:cation:proton antiporter [Halorhabdus rudnickae]